MARKGYGSVGSVGSARKSGASARDRLRGRHYMKYHNGFLTQDRVRQKFGFYTDGSYEGWDQDEVEEDNYQLELDDRHFVPDGVQLELKLETTDELEGKLRNMISRYKAAIDHMGAYALLWDDLMEDIENNRHLEEEFKKFQMLRKLSGGTL